MSDSKVIKFLERILVRKSNSRTAHELELKSDGASGVKTSVVSVGTEDVEATLPKKSGIIASSKVDLVEGLVITDTDGQLLIYPNVDLTELSYLDGVTGPIQGQLDTLDARLDSAQTAILDHEGRIDTLETQVSDINLELIGLDARLDILELDPVTKTYVDENIGGFEFDQTVKEEGDVITWDGTKFVTAPSSGVGNVKVTLLDHISTVLPSGSSATIDGVSVSDGDLVLFTNLTLNSNRVYSVSGVGVSLVWTAEDLFSGEVDPTQGDIVVVQEGDMFAGQQATLNGPNFVINDNVRYFNEDLSDFYEISGIRVTPVADGSTTTLFTVSSNGSENMIIDFSVVRGTEKEVGQIFLASNGVTVEGATSSVGSSGVTFSAEIVGSDIVVKATATSTTFNATVKYSVKRWSDDPGGTTGIPDYNVADPQVIQNKDIDGGTASNLSRLTIPKAPKATLDALTRKEGTLVYASDEDKLYVDDGSALVEVGSGGGGASYADVEITSTTVDWTLGTSFFKDITSNTSLTMTSPVLGKTIDITITNTTGSVVSLDFTNTGIYGIEPIPSTVDPNSANIYSFLYSDGKYYYTAISTLTSVQ